MQRSRERLDGSKEYNVLEIYLGQTATLERLLNEHAGNGWQLHSIVPIATPRADAEGAGREGATGLLLITLVRGRR
jgi:hypothetical protein